MYTFLKISMQYLCWLKIVYISNFVVSNCTSPSIWFFFVFPSQLGLRNDVFFSWKLGIFGSNVMRFVGQRNFDKSYLPLWNPFKTKNQKQLFCITQFDKWMILKDVFLLIFPYVTFFIKLNDDRSKLPHRFFSHENGKSQVEWFIYLYVENGCFHKGVERCSRVWAPWLKG